MKNHRLNKGIVLVEAPSNLGLKPLQPGVEPGTRMAPGVLGELGLSDAIGAVERLSVVAPKYWDDIDNPTGIRCAESIKTYSLDLADHVEAIIRNGQFPFVVGGDCSILLGSMLGACRITETSLLFIDGHTDFYLPSQSETGGAAGMDLALATGWGPESLTNLEGRHPIVKLENVAVLGNRDFEPRSSADIPDLANSPAYYRSLSDMRLAGVRSSVEAAIEHIDGYSQPFWIHLDVDALDDAIMPAVDSPQKGGFCEEEILTILKTAITANPVGTQMTIYDPDKDPDHKAGSLLVDIMRDLFSKA